MFVPIWLTVVLLFLLFSLTNGQCYCDTASNRDALRLIYTDLNGVNWPRSYQWDFDNTEVTVCDFVFVNCTWEMNELSEISLDLTLSFESYQFVSGTLSKAGFAMLSDLQRLQLEAFGITGPIPDSVCGAFQRYSMSPIPDSRANELLVYTPSMKDALPSCVWQIVHKLTLSSVMPSVFLHSNLNGFSSVRSLRVSSVYGSWTLPRSGVINC